MSWKEKNILWLGRLSSRRFTLIVHWSWTLNLTFASILINLYVQTESIDNLESFKYCVAWNFSWDFNFADCRCFVFLAKEIFLNFDFRVARLETNFGRTLFFTSGAYITTRKYNVHFTIINFLLLVSWLQFKSYNKVQQGVILYPISAG